MEPSPLKVAQAIRNAHIAYEYTIHHRSLREIAGRYNLSWPRIRKIVLSLDGEMRRPGRPEKGGPRYG